MKYLTVYFTLCIIYSTNASGTEQMPEKNKSNETKWVKNTNWSEANQLAIYNCGWGFEIRTIKNKSS